MAYALNSLLTVTVSSAVLYGAILLFKAAFRKQLSAVLNFAVWALLILRLMIPVTLESGVRLIVLPAPQAQAQAAHNPVPPASGQNNAPVINIKGQSAQNSPATAVTAPVSSDRNIFTAIGWQTALLILWAAGALGWLSYRSILLLRLRHKLTHSGAAAPRYVLAMVERCKRELGIKADIPVSVQRWQNSPALSSSFRPVLLLPEKMLRHMEAQQLEFGIRHELAHFKRGDHLTSLLLLFLRCVWWFNPVVWLAFPQIETDMESACDASVTGELASPDKKRYVETMIDLGTGAELPYMLGMGARHEKKTLEKRIRSVYMKKKSGRFALFAALMAAVLLFVACFTTACLPQTAAPAAAPGTVTTAATDAATPSPAVSASPAAAATTATPEATASVQNTPSPEATAAAGNLNAAVSAAALAKLWDDPFGEVRTEGHVILSTAQDKDGNTVVYAVASYCTYGFENGLFTVTSGSGSIPAVITLAKDGNGYKPVSYKEPTDGSGYSASLKKLFPQELWDKVQHADQFSAELEKQQEVYAKAYLKSIGRDTADVHSGYVEKEPLHIKAEASNALIGMPKLGNYPTWNGSRETIENGVRYVYVAMEDDVSDYAVITYTKKTADGKIVEQLKYKITGTTVSQMP